MREIYCKAVCKKHPDCLKYKLVKNQEGFEGEVMVCKDPIFEDELKPCPFRCGEVPVIHFQETTFSETGEIYSILCNCGQAKAIGRTRRELVEKWNKRWPQ